MRLLGIIVLFCSIERDLSQRNKVTREAVENKQRHLVPIFRSITVVATIR